MHFLIFLDRALLPAGHHCGRAAHPQRHSNPPAQPLLGWTVIGWFVALLMAICSAPYYVYYYRRGWYRKAPVA